MSLVSLFLRATLFEGICFRCYTLVQLAKLWSSREQVSGGAELCIVFLDCLSAM